MEKRFLHFLERILEELLFLTCSFVSQRGSHLLIVDSQTQLTYSSLLWPMQGILALLVKLHSHLPIDLITATWVGNLPRLLGVPSFIYYACSSVSVGFCHSVSLCRGSAMVLGPKWWILSPSGVGILQYHFFVCLFLGSLFYFFPLCCQFIQVNHTLIKLSSCFFQPFPDPKFLALPSPVIFLWDLL